jgi:hypothetical protein
MISTLYKNLLSVVKRQRTLAASCGVLRLKIKTFGKPSLFREYPNAYYIKELPREYEIMPAARFSRTVLSNQFMLSYVYSLEDQGNSGA